jgi:hypothetical protein
MKCKQIKINLPDYLHNRLDPELRQTIAEHLTTCQDCSREFDFLRTYYGQLPNTEPITAPADFLAQVRLKTIDAKPEPKWNFNFTRLLPIAGITTVLALACLIFFLVTPLRPMPLSDNGRHEISKRTPETIAKAPKQKILLEKPAVKPPVARIAKAQPAIKPARPSTIPPAFSELAVVLKVVEITATKSIGDTELFKELAKSTAENSETKPEPAPVESAAPADLKIRLVELIQNLGGQINDQAFDPGSNRLQKMTFTLPATKYNELSAGLNDLGQAALPPLTPSDQAVTLKITLQLQYEP